MSAKDNYLYNNYHPIYIIDIINGLNDFCLNNIKLHDKQFDHLLVYINDFCSDCITIFDHLIVTTHTSYGLIIEYTCFMARLDVFLIAIKNTPIDKYLPIPLKDKTVSINDIIEYHDKIRNLCLILKKNVEPSKIKNNKCIIC